MDPLPPDPSKNELTVNRAAEPAPTPPLISPSWKVKYGPMIVWILSIILTAITSAVTTYFGVPTPPPLIVNNTTETIREVPVVAPNPLYTQSFGWAAPDQETLDASADPAKTLQFKATPAGQAVQGDVEAFLWQAVRKVNNRGPPWYPNVDQGPVGCCVGAGWKHCTDVVQATQILNGRRAEWKPTSVEVIYGESRVDVGGGRISGDGSLGAWARAAAEKFGVAPMRKYDSVDLSVFSPARARQFGKSGVPPDVKAVAIDHVIKGTALVKTWIDVKRAIAQGYPVAVCSDQGFTMERDKDGFARPQGVWNHCMSFIAVRGAPREGAFCLNSWGDQAHTGPAYPADMPVAGFWVDWKTVERMVSQGDSFALADIAGFPARKPDWFIRADDAPRNFATLYNPRFYAPFGRDVYALAP